MPREAATKEPRSTKPRKRAAGSRASASTSSRKAPTGLTREAGGSTLTKQYALAMLGAVLIISASVGVGVSDAGQIDVTAIIEERNAKVEAGEAPAGESESSSRVSVPVQNTNTEPNGGLRGAGDPPPPPPPEPVTGTSTATSSEDGTATSTESTATSSERAVIDEESTDASAEPAGATSKTPATEPEA